MVVTDNLFYVIVLSVLRKKPLKTMVKARKSALNFDAYCFERALVFVSIHHWVNSKRAVGQSVVINKVSLKEKKGTNKPDIPLKRWTIRKMVTIFNLANMSC